jgi:hypothetical protein
VWTVGFGGLLWSGLRCFATSPILRSLPCPALTNIRLFASRLQHGQALQFRSDVAAESGARVWYGLYVLRVKSGYKLVDLSPATSLVGRFVLLLSTIFLTCFSSLLPHVSRLAVILVRNIFKSPWPTLCLMIVTVPISRFVSTKPC